MSDLVILKFGSSVLRSVADMPTVVAEIGRHRSEGHRVVAVVSAIGNGTDELLSRAREVSPAPEPWALAELLATGERVSAALLAIALAQAGLQGRVINPREIDFIISGPPLDGEPLSVDNRHAEALLDESPILILPGFFGVNAAGRTILMGRGGSDFSAVFLSVALHARCRLLKDVDGVYESDPASPNSHPRRFSELHYDDAMRVAGRLVQPKAIDYLRKHLASCEVAAIGRPYCTLVHNAASRWSP